MRFKREGDSYFIEDYDRLYWNGKEWTAEKHPFDIVQAEVEWATLIYQDQSASVLEDLQENKRREALIYWLFKSEERAATAMQMYFHEYIDVDDIFDVIERLYSTTEKPSPQQSQDKSSS